MTAAARIIVGDVIDGLGQLEAGSVHTCVTSPPYWGLRDYGVEGQIGLEPTPEAFVERIVEVFRAVRRVLRDDATLWVNLGDSYAGNRRGDEGDRVGLEGTRRSQQASRAAQRAMTTSRRRDDAPCPRSDLAIAGVKPKDLVGIPWRVAFALQADGWWLRQDIIWHKPNPMPESVRDRCTKAHEYLFLLSKSQRYYFDAEAMAEPVTDSTIARISQPTIEQQAGSDRVPGKTNGPMRAVVKRSRNKARKPATERGCPADGVAGNIPWEGTTRNRRSVWSVTTKPYTGAHFATFPPDLIEPCILAGAPVGGTVLDPFLGSGTTAAVALKHGRNAVGVELNPEYAELARRRVAEVAPLFLEASA